MKFVLISGPSCVGKSTVIKKVLEEMPRYYKISYDALKWGFSQYDPSTHFEDVKKLVRALTEATCSMGYNVISDSALYKETRESLLAIAKKYEYEIIEINLEAEYETLLSRFEKRLLDASANPQSKIANTSKERHRQLYDIYMAERNVEAKTFYTDREGIELTAEKILQLL